MATETRDGHLWVRRGVRSSCRLAVPHVKAAVCSAGKGLEGHITLNDNGSIKEVVGRVRVLTADNRRFSVNVVPQRPLSGAATRQAERIMTP